MLFLSDDIDKIMWRNGNYENDKIKMDNYLHIPHKIVI